MRQYQQLTLVGNIQRRSSEQNSLEALVAIALTAKVHNALADTYDTKFNMADRDNKTTKLHWKTAIKDQWTVLSDQNGIWRIQNNNMYNLADKNNHVNWLEL